jgi:hypothetical protein
VARKFKLTFPKGTPVDDDFLSFVDSLFSELNLSPQMAQHAADRWGQYVGQRFAANESNAQRELAALRSELGSGYDSAISAGQRGARQLGIDKKTLDGLEGSLGLASTLKLMSAIGRRFDGSGSPASGGGSSPANGDPDLASPQAARAAIEKLQQSRAWSDKLFDPKAEGHAEAKERWNTLHAVAYPEPAAAPPPSTATGDDGSKAAAAKAKINELIGNDAFMGSLRDPKHSEHQANRQTFDNLHADAGIVR